ncbi:DDE-type integrase/transposase/recombinase [Paraburkholderia fynbosensis]|uniref:DDE domain-containing protein n=1 Tax=Paraburkholderia fynbosensis TaxID=1200993 RepID=A0A6J5GWL4_9BURK|nr:hypothetical protein LMG27177_06353 [Paraburkholderia fynbosensis]
MSITLRGELYLIGWAVDQHCVELDILLQKRRNKAAAKRFSNACSPRVRRAARIVTDELMKHPTINPFPAATA